MHTNCDENTLRIRLRDRESDDGEEIDENAGFDEEEEKEDVRVVICDKLSRALFCGLFFVNFFNKECF